MNFRRLILLIVSACNTALFATTHSNAGSINIPNFSFEADQVPANTVQQGNANWTSVVGPSGDFGRFHAGGEFSQPAFPTDGTQVAFFGTTGGYAYQSLSATYQSGMYYQLLIDVANRINRNAFPPSINVELFAGSNRFNPVAILPLNTSNVQVGKFLTYDLAVNPSVVASLGITGQTIGIHFLATGGTGFFDLDNVRLNESPTPEPATLILVAFGVFAQVARRHRAQ